MRVPSPSGEIRTSITFDNPSITDGPLLTGGNRAAFFSVMPIDKAQLERDAELMQIVAKGWDVQFGFSAPDLSLRYAGVDASSFLSVVPRANWPMPDSPQRKGSAEFYGPISATFQGVKVALGNGLQ